MNIAMLDGVEKQLAEWYKGAPNLPKNVSAWIAKYAWVFVLASAVITGLAILGLLSALGLLGAATYIDGVTGYRLFSWVALLSLVVYLIFLIKAISPLKAQQKEGWKLIFYLQFFYIAFGLLQWLARPIEIGSLVWTLLSVVVGFYFLFQIKPYFKQTTSKY